MYGVRLLRRNGTERKPWEGRLVGFAFHGDWMILKPFIVGSLEEAERKAAKMQQVSDHLGGNCRYLATPLPFVQQWPNWYVFDYPMGGEMEEYIQHRGLSVRILQFVDPGVSGADGMVEIEARDGWRGYAFQCELREIKAED